MKILVLDNYDSFTFNLVHYVEDIINERVDVFRNDKIQLSEIKKYDKIILSPGPGIPENSGILKSLIKEYSATKSIFGVCLGMQAIAEVFGSKLFNLKKVYHGISTKVIQTNVDNVLFKDIPKEFIAGRYHSWIVDNEDFSGELIISSVDEQNQIMSLFHSKFDVRGVQFHPESVMTPVGKKIIENWLRG